MEMKASELLEGLLRSFSSLMEDEYRSDTKLGKFIGTEYELGLECQLYRIFLISWQ